MFIQILLESNLLFGFGVVKVTSNNFHWKLYHVENVLRTIQKIQIWLKIFIVSESGFDF